MTDNSTRSEDDEQRLIEAVALANVPTLLMVLVQLTGETGWLDAPYTPTRQTGMGDNDSGGLDPQRQEEVREAALEAILAWRAGRPVAIPEPDEAMLVRMLAVAMAERIPDEYGAFTAAQLGQASFVDHRPIAELQRFIEKSLRLLALEFLVDRIGGEIMISFNDDGVV